MYSFQKTHLISLVGVERAERWYEPLRAVFMQYGLTNARRQAHFLAQIFHESLGLSVLEENLNYSAARLLQIFPRYFPSEQVARQYERNPRAIANRVYANRLGNGSEASGDGWIYRGRGPIQLTGRSNYRAAGQAIGLDLEANPDALKRPEVGARVAGWFWSTRRVAGLGLNVYADLDQIVIITRAINGGLNGLEGRRLWLNKCKRVLVEVVL